jgi:HEAT repeat protein
MEKEPLPADENGSMFANKRGEHVEIKRLLLWLMAAGVITGSAAFVRWQYPASPHAPAIAGAIEDLASCDYEARDRAAETLKQAGPECVPYLARALSRHESLWRRYAGRLPLVRPAPRNLAAIRERSAEQLALIAPDDPRASHALIRALGDENMEVQRALRKIGPSEQLTAALRAGNPKIRRGVAEVLTDLGPRASASAPALAHALNDKEESVRAQAAEALGAIGAPSSAARLIAALNDQQPSVRSAAAESLGKLRASASVPSLTQKLSDPEVSVAVKSAQALWRIERKPDLVVPVLIRALRDRRAGSDAKFVLGEIGASAKDAVPALVQSLREERVARPLRTPPSSALALGRIGVPAMPDLVSELKNDHSEVRTSAAIALGFIGKTAHDAAPHLIPLLADKNLEVRQAAALALGSIEPDNRDLVPALRQLARDDDIFLASAASAMLRNLDPAAAIELGLE